MVAQLQARRRVGTRATHNGGGGSVAVERLHEWARVAALLGLAAFIRNVLRFVHRGIRVRVVLVVHHGPALRARRGVLVPADEILHTGAT